MEDVDDRELGGQGLRPRLPLELSSRIEIKGCKVQPEQLGQTLHQLCYHGADLDLAGESLPHLHHRPL